MAAHLKDEAGKSRDCEVVVLGMTGPALYSKSVELISGLRGLEKCPAF